MSLLSHLQNYNHRNIGGRGQEWALREKEVTNLEKKKKASGEIQISFSVGDKGTALLRMP